VERELPLDSILHASQYDVCAHELSREPEPPGASRIRRAPTLLSGLMHPILDDVRSNASPAMTFCIRDVCAFPDLLTVLLASAYDSISTRRKSRKRIVVAEIQDAMPSSSIRRSRRQPWMRLPSSSSVDAGRRSKCVASTARNTRPDLRIPSRASSRCTLSRRGCRVGNRIDRFAVEGGGGVLHVRSMNATGSAFDPPNPRPSYSSQQQAAR